MRKLRILPYLLGNYCKAIEEVSQDKVLWKVRLISEKQNNGEMLRVHELLAQ